ncbi:MAG TPA: V4R domain-containing protein [Gemmatimonadaceae bacterium]|nr:V4R domain-containing protein [Gemmatimonadaceae bacterium]
MLDLANHSMLALSRAALTALRSALIRDAGPAAAAYLRDAGYAGGETVFASFRDWLRSEQAPSPEELGVEEFAEYATRYFRDAGWGSISIGSLGDAVATVDSEDWAEADPASALEMPGCHLTTGMFADFFGRLSDTPLAVLEVECRSAGSHRCRFLLGNADVMTYIFEEMEAGSQYEAAATEIQ